MKSILLKVAFFALGLINVSLAQYSLVSVYNAGNTPVTVHISPHSGSNCETIIFNNINPGQTKAQKVLRSNCAYGSAQFYQTRTGKSWGSSDINQLVYLSQYPEASSGKGPTFWVNNSWGGQWGIGLQKPAPSIRQFSGLTPEENSVLTPQERTELAVLNTYARNALEQTLKPTLDRRYQLLHPAQPFNPKYLPRNYFVLGNFNFLGDTRYALYKGDGQWFAGFAPNTSNQLPFNYAHLFALDRPGAIIRLICQPKTNQDIRPILHVYVEKVPNGVTMVIGTPPKQKNVSINSKQVTVTEAAKGIKIFFNTSQFEDYFRKTYFYKNLSGQEGPQPNFEGVGLSFGFKIDSSKVSLIDPNNITQILDIFDIQILTQPISQTPGKLDPNTMKMVHLVSLYKIAGKNYTENMNMADLYANKAIAISPLSSDDARLLTEGYKF